MRTYGSRVTSHTRLAASVLCSPALRSSIFFVAVAQEPTDLLGVADTPLGPSLPAGWEVRAVKDRNPPRTDVRVANDLRVLRIEGEGDAGWLRRLEWSPTQ